MTVFGADRAGVVGVFVRGRAQDGQVGIGKRFAVAVPWCRIVRSGQTYQAGDVAHSFSGHVEVRELTFSTVSAVVFVVGSTTVDRVVVPSCHAHSVGVISVRLEFIDATQYVTKVGNIVIPPVRFAPRS